MQDAHPIWIGKRTDTKLCHDITTFLSQPWFPHTHLIRTPGQPYYTPKGLYSNSMNSSCSPTTTLSTKHQSHLWVCRAGHREDGRPGHMRHRVGRVSWVGEVLRAAGQVGL